MQEKSDKPTPRRWVTARANVSIVRPIFWWIGILLLGGGITALGIYLAGSTVVLSSWLQQVKFPLFLWRLTLYAIVAGLWFHRVRAALLWQASLPSIVYRLEIMMVSLMLLIEFTNYRWGM